MADIDSLTSRRRAWQFALGSPLVLGPFWWWLVGRIPGLSEPGLVNPVFCGVAGYQLVFALSSSSVTDFRWRRIPNWCTYSTALWAVLLNTVHSVSETFLDAGQHQALQAFLGTVGLRDCLFGFFACFAATLFVYRLSGGGAGDVKLAAAVGSILGLNAGVQALLFAWAAAGAGILVWALLSYGPVFLIRSFGRRIGAWLLPAYVLPPSDAQAEMLGRPVPLASFFAVGTLAGVFKVIPL